MIKALAATYVIAVIALAAAAYLALGFRCEGFGCMGVAVAWVAWVIAVFVVLAGGAPVRASSSLSERLRKKARARLCGLSWHSGLPWSFSGQANASADA